MAEPSPAQRKRSALPPAGPALRGVQGRVRETGFMDGLVHHRLRLGIVSALAAVEALSFNDLKAILGTTDGNLSVHARKLEEAQYVTCTKTFEGRRPRTEYRLAPRGRQALARYLDHMEALIRTTRDTMAR